MKLFKIPFSGGGLGHGNGANAAPDAIVEQLQNVFSNESGDEIKFDVRKIDVDENNIELSQKEIEKDVSKLLSCDNNKDNDNKNNKQKAILLGGDHSITYPAVKAFAKHNPNLVLIVFDAHPDMVNCFKPVTQEDYLKVLIEESIVKPENVILVGLRNWDKSEIDYIKEKGVNCFTCKEMFEKGFKETVSGIIQIIENKNLPTYLSIDIDCVDPVEAIGTGYTEHGGLSSRELIYALQKIKSTSLVKVADLVEINPQKDVNGITVALGTKVLSELFGF